MLALRPGTKKQCIARDALKASGAFDHDHTERFKERRIKCVEDRVLDVHGEG